MRKTEQETIAESLIQNYWNFLTKTYNVSNRSESWKTTENSVKSLLKAWNQQQQKNTLGLGFIFLGW